MRSELDSAKHLYADLLAAWNARDAAAFARLFASEGRMIGFDGSTAVGRSEIEQHLHPIFSDHPTARYVAIVRDVHSITPETALLFATASMVPPGKDKVMPERNCMQVLLASKEQEDRWLIELFQNTPAAWHGRESDVRQLTEELQREFEENLEEAIS